MDGSRVPSPNLYIRWILCSGDSDMNQSQIILFCLFGKTKHVLKQLSYKSCSAIYKGCGRQTTKALRVRRISDHAHFLLTRSHCFCISLFSLLERFLTLRIFHAYPERLSNLKQINSVNTYPVSALSLVCKNLTSLVSLYFYHKKMIEWAWNSDGLGGGHWTYIQVSILSSVSNATFGD